MEAVTEQPQTEVVPEVTPEAAPAPEAKQFDPSAIPAEIKEYFSKQMDEEKKKYSDYEEKKKAADEWNQVRSDPRWGKYVESLNAPPVAKPFEITDEQFTAALTDKSQFLNLVNQAAERLVQDRVGPQLQQTQYQIEFARANAEIEQMKARYPDFVDLDKRNLIAPYVQKYRGISFEDAYWLAKRETFNEEVDKKARGVVDKKKMASVERPGNPPGAKPGRVRARNRLEAMEMVADAVSAGREVPEFDEIGDE